LTDKVSHGGTSKTGWPPPPLMQDDCRELSLWFATRLGSLHTLKTIYEDNMILRAALEEARMAQRVAELDARYTRGWRVPCLFPVLSTAQQHAQDESVRRLNVAVNQGSHHRSK
jgi:hypothetical protein